MDSSTPTNPQPNLAPVAPLNPVTPEPTTPVVPPAHQDSAPAELGNKNKLRNSFAVVGIVFLATAFGAVAYFLPKQTGENRSQAAAAPGMCKGEITVAASSCNEGCAVDLDCMNGMVCYKTNGGTEGVCRNAQTPTSPTCSAVASASPVATPKTSTTPTPAAACTKTCSFNYDCNLAANEQCVGTNANNPTPGVTANPPRTATAAELAVLAPDQIISMGPDSQYKADGTGKMPFTVVSKKATTFTVKVFDITAEKNQLDPQKLVYSQSFTIGANQTVTGNVILPRCGRYQVDFASNIVAGTKYDSNVAAHYFWGTVFEIPCQTGCCRPVTTPLPQSVSAPQDLVRLALIDLSTNKAVDGYTALTANTTFTKVAGKTYTIQAVSFPNTFPTGIGSIKFEVDGQLVRIDNDDPFNMTESAFSPPVGTHVIKATLYPLDNATGTPIDTMTVNLTVK